MREMKDSGVEWIGEIPVEWEIRKLNDVAERITDFVASGSFASLKENVTYLDEPNYAMLIRTADISNRSNLSHIYIDKDAYDFLKNSNLFGGEIILPNIGSVGDVYMYEPMYDRASLAPNSIMMDMKESNRFYYYWLLNPMVNEALKKIGSDSVQAKFNKTQLRQFRVVRPSKEEQQKIATYLDQKIALIDNIIEKTKESIEEYKAYKQSLITETVTKGLNPDVKIKDSGIEWIGEIPEHWKLKKIRFLGSLQNGISKSADQFGSGTPFVSYGDAYKNYELPYEVDGLVNAMDSDKENYSIKSGDVLFTRTSETIEEIGFASTCIKTIEEATFAGFLIRFRPYDSNIIDGYYSKYFFRSDMHRRFFVKEMNLVTRASLSQELLKKLPVVLPPLEEQNEIGAYLEEKCNDIDNTINKKIEIILELETYKKSLIYEVVTGKREVI